MKERTPSALTFRIINIAFYLLTACTDGTEMSDKFSKDLRSKINMTASGGTLRIDEIHTGDWDKLYIFGPYTTEEYVISTLSSPEKLNISLERISERDDINLLIFSKAGVPLKSIAVPRSYGDFSLKKNDRVFDRADAIFVKSGDNLLVLKKPSVK